MFKAITIGSVLFVTALATNFEPFVDNNLIGYEVPVHLQRASFPMPYQFNAEEKLVQPSYDAVVIPTVKEVPSVAAVEVSKMGLISTAVSYLLSAIKTVVACLVRNGLGVIVGAMAASGLCIFTPVCKKLSAISSVLELEHEVRSFATPERLARAADFVHNAIEKYNSLQN